MGKIGEMVEVTAKELVESGELLAPFMEPGLMSYTYSRKRTTITIEWGETKITKHYPTTRKERRRWNRQERNRQRQYKDQAS